MPQPLRVADIRQVPEQVGLEPRLKAVLRDKVLLTGNSGYYGEELWVSDGTEAGTVMIKDIFPGPGSPGIQEIVPAVSAAQLAFFAADDGVHGRELWCTDGLRSGGERSGTRMVADAVGEPGKGLSPERITAFQKGVLFYSVLDGNLTVWLADLTSAGMRQIASVPYRIDWTYSQTSDHPLTCTVGNRCFFFLPNASYGRLDLWVTDGTEAGTVLVKEASPNTHWLAGGLGSSLIFYVQTPAQNIELWKSDGTRKGTVRLKAFGAPWSLAAPESFQMAVISGKGYFIAPGSGSSGPHEIWVTNGTEAGTLSLWEALRLPLFPGVYYKELKAIGSRLITNYRYVDFPLGGGLESINLAGKTPSAQLIFDTFASPQEETVRHIVCTNDRAFFVTSSGESADAPRQFWFTNGGIAMPLQDLSPDSTTVWGRDVRSKEDLAFVIAGNRAYFPAKDGGSGLELCKANGPIASMVKDIQKDAAGSKPVPLGTGGGMSPLTYFSADDGVNGRELWSTDGTEAGTRLIEINDGPGGSDPSEVMKLNDRTYFVADDGVNGRELWSIHHTTVSSIELVKDIWPGETGSAPEHLHVFKDRLYFTATTEAQGRELWSTDGTEAGTVLVANLALGSTSSSPAELTTMDGWLYFTAEPAGFPFSRKLFRTDGTASPVQLSTESVPENLTVRPPTPGAAVAADKHVLYFSTPDFSGVPSLWRCSNGEQPVKIHAFTFPFNHKPISLNVAGDRLVIECSQGPSVRVLWVSDGTSAGTTRLLQPDPEQGDRHELAAVVGNKVYYRFSGLYPDEPTGLKCINIDGSSPADLLPDEPRTAIRSMHVQGDTLFFACARPGQIWTLWQTRGTPETTFQISDLPLPVSDYDFSNPQKTHTAVSDGHRLYFAADINTELFSLSLRANLELVNGSTVIRTSKPNGTLQAGTVPTGESRVRTVQVRNTGWQSMLATQFTVPGQDDYAITNGIIGVLPPGGVHEVQITFTPQASGTRETAARLSGVHEISEAFDFDVTLTGKGLGPDDAPLIGVNYSNIQPRLALIGENITFDLDAVAPAGAAYTWKKDKTIVGQEPVLTLNSVQEADAGSYLLNIASAGGKKASLAIPLLVITPAPASVQAWEGGQLNLTCTVKNTWMGKPSYQWFRNGFPLANIQGIRGSQTATLKIPQVRRQDAGSYSCEVTLAIGSVAPPARRSHGSTVVTVAPRPRIILPEMLGEAFRHFINQEVSYQIQTDVPATRFTVKGLPPGLKVSPGGLITGRPLKTQGYGPDSAMNGFAAYEVTVSAGNDQGFGQPVSFPWHVLAFLPAGTHEGLFNRHLTLDGGRYLGNRLTLTVSTAGAISGQLLHGGKTYRFTGAGFSADTTASPPRAELSIPRGGKLTPLVITFTQNDPFWDVILKDSTGQEAEGLLRQPLFSAKQTAGAYAGASTFVFSSLLQVPPDEQNYGPLPQGPAFFTATVSKTGIMTWKGKMPDGSAVTGSAPLCGHLDSTTLVPLHHDLYQATGSVQGWVELLPPEETGGLLRFNGNVDWYKAPMAAKSVSRIYKEGLGIHPLGIDGGTYTPPAKGTRILGLPGTESNVLYYVQEASETAPYLVSPLTLTARNTALLPPVDLDHPVKTLTFNPTQGTFRGTLSFLHPTDRRLNRTATFEGVLLPAHTVATGFFLLPELPAEGQPASALKTTPIRSGRIDIGP